MNQNYWLFNTDETEREAEGAYREMIDQNVIAAWGYSRGTGHREPLINPKKARPFLLPGQERPYCERASDGPRVQGEDGFRSKSEYHRAVNNLQLLPAPLTVAEIRERSGYNLPCRHIVCRLNDKAGVRFI